MGRIQQTTAPQHGTNHLVLDHNILGHSISKTLEQSYPLT